MQNVPIPIGVRKSTDQDEVDKQRSPIERNIIELVVEGTTQALDRRPEQRPADRPRLLDKRQTAAALLISVRYLDELRKEGLPCIMLGDSPRFDLEVEVLPWLRARRAVTR